MSALSQLLERLRRVQPAPGAAAGVLAVPSAGEELSREVAFMFGELDGISEGAEQILRAAHADAAAIEAQAERERIRLLHDAHAEAERVVAVTLAAARRRGEAQARAMLADAQREAARIEARGRERTPAFVRSVVETLLERGS